MLGIFALKKIRISNLIVSTLGATVIFFLVSNFGVWFSGIMYPKDLGELMTCYTTGIPFFKNIIAGDLAYTTVMFGAFEWSVRKYPHLQLQQISI